MHDTEETSPLKFFDAQPVYGKRVVIVFIQPESDTDRGRGVGGTGCISINDLSTWSRFSVSCNLAVHVTGL